MAKGKYHEWLEEDGLIRIRGWARDGLTNEQIAQNMGISSETLRVWSNTYSAISVALKESKDAADRQVENALYKSAMGFWGPDGKYYPPSTTAQIFWLKNRKRLEWRDKPVEEDTDRTITIRLEDEAVGD
jgi:hypothetical protein